MNECVYVFMYVYAYIIFMCACLSVNKKPNALLIACAKCHCNTKNNAEILALWVVAEACLSAAEFPPPTKAKSYNSNTKYKRKMHANLVILLIYGCENICVYVTVCRSAFSALLPIKRAWSCQAEKIFSSCVCGFTGSWFCWKIKRWFRFPIELLVETAGMRNYNWLPKKSQLRFL